MFPFDFCVFRIPELTSRAVTPKSLSLFFLASSVSFGYFILN
jgi:hypothetical protein